MDFKKPPTAIEGEFERILVVRDLASGNLLLALPTKDETGATVAAAIRALNLEHGAPLVLKSDNGPGFLSPVLREVLHRFGVLALFSPPYTPRYRGAVEAGIGGLQARAHHLSAQAGRAGEWTCDDVEQARCEANEKGRPHGLSAGIPREIWEHRVRPDAAARRAFRSAVARALRAVRAEHRQANVRPAGCSRHRRHSPVRRAAIARALTEQKILEFRTRRIPQPISSPIPANII
jgi:transposase InsO family protein